MQPKIANPAWPRNVIEIFKRDTGTTQFGCGRCGHAEWVAKTDKDGLYFTVSVCRAGIALQNGSPIDYCTAAQTPLVQPQSNELEEKSKTIKPYSALLMPKSGTYGPRGEIR